MTKERNRGLDAARFVMAFLVVCIHVPYEGYWGHAFMALTRIAVPFFFILSGYFLGNKLEDSTKILKQFKQIALITLFATGVYFIWYLALAIYQRTGVSNYLESIFSFKSIFNWIIYNDPAIGFHLWYLYAYLYTLIIVYIAVKFNVVQYLFYLIPVLLSVDLIFGKYSLVVWKTEFPVHCVRNFLFLGLPFFMIGSYLRKNESLLNKLKTTAPMMVIIFVITTLVEYFILENLGLNATRDHYISTVFLTIFTFAFASSRNIKSKILSIVADCGKNYSLDIYVYQIIWVNIMTSVLIRMPKLTQFYAIFAPAVVFALSLMSAIVLQKIKQKLGWRI